MGINPVTIRSLITTICIVMLLWGCESATQPPAKQKVVRKKIVFPQKQTTTARKAKTAPVAKTKTVAQSTKKARPAEVKKPLVAEVKADRQPLIAQKGETQPPKAKKPAIKPKSEVSKIKQPVTIQPLATGQKSATSYKSIAPAPKTAKVLTGIPGAYDPKGKIDPFQPLFRDKPVLAKKKKRKRLPQTPLERIEISQLKLVGIILASSGNRALVEETSGKGYVIKKGTYIGTNSGKVVKINKENVIVEEEFEDVFGKSTTRQREIKLPKPPGAF